jgi:hypothetical protein
MLRLAALVSGTVVVTGSGKLVDRRGINQPALSLRPCADRANQALVISCKPEIRRIPLMQTIVIASGKGGSGKTTLTAHLAVEAGSGAWVVDTDKQATLLQWHERRESDTPGRLDMPFAQLAKGLTALAEDSAAWCFIDTAPASREQTAAVLRLADVVVIPVRPSPADLWAVGETVDLAKRKAFSVRHQPGQGTGLDYGPSRRSAFRTWAGRANLGRRSRGLCGGLDKREHGPRTLAPRTGRQRDCRLMGRGEIVLCRKANNPQQSWGFEGEPP